MQKTVEAIWGNSRPPFATDKDASLTEHFMVNPAPDDGVDRYTDVTKPELYFFPVAGPAPHPAVLVLPGGGYHHLSWNAEGCDIASYLNGCGFSAFVLKYRCPDRRSAAIADGARAMRCIRANAARFAIDPTRLGVIGFSAGAHMAATLSAPASADLYEAADEVDRFSFRPDFTMLIYPAYLCDKELHTAPEFSVTPQVPPTFLVQAEDDWVNVECSLGWYLALKKAGVPAEMHLFAEGGHGYGLRRTGKPIADWGEAAVRWLRRMTLTK